MLESENEFYQQGLYQIYPISCIPHELLLELSVAYTASTFNGPTALKAECSLNLHYTVTQLCVLEQHTTCITICAHPEYYHESNCLRKKHFSILYNLNPYPVGHQAPPGLHSLHLHLFIPVVGVLTNDLTTSQQTIAFS